MKTNISSMCLSVHYNLKMGVGVSLDLYVDTFDTGTNTIHFGKSKYKNGVEDSFRCFHRDVIKMEV